jgi:hypothetical protein
MDTLRRESPAMATEVNAELERAIGVLESTLPLPTSDEPQTTFSSTSAVVSVGAAVVLAMVSLSTLQPSPSRELWGQVDRYQQLVTEEGRADEARRRVGILFPNLVARFTPTQDTARTAKTTAEQEAAALQMRTFIDSSRASFGRWRPSTWARK